MISSSRLFKNVHALWQIFYKWTWKSSGKSFSRRIWQHLKEAIKAERLSGFPWQEPTFQDYLQRTDDGLDENLAHMKSPDGSGQGPSTPVCRFEQQTTRFPWSRAWKQLCFSFLCPLPLVFIGMLLWTFHSDTMTNKLPFYLPSLTGRWYCLFHASVWRLIKQYIC